MGGWRLLSESIDTTRVRRPCVCESVCWSVQIDSTFLSRQNALIPQYSQVFLFMAVESRVEVANLQGRVTKTLTFGDSEGIPLHFDVNGGYLVVSCCFRVLTVR